MKKIGLLYGIEKRFPETVLKLINSIGKGKVLAEPVKLGPSLVDAKSEYELIFDLVSNEVPFYRSLLKHFALNNIKIVNNPFFSSEDDEFLHNSVAKAQGLPVPKTVILPSKEHPYGTSSDTFQNLIYPVDWEKVFEYIGFPAMIKPNFFSILHNSYKIYNKNEFFAAYNNTGNLPMVLQEFIQYDSYYRCFVIGKKETKIIDYNPLKPLHLRYNAESSSISKELEKKIIEYSIKISTLFDFDFNAMEFAVKDEKLFIIDFLNQAPTVESNFLKEETFDWIVKTTANMLIEKAEQKEGSPNHIFAKKI
ncbi:MAG: hypothetical protein GX121_10810 [Ignavibacteria bacterium]|nr:hypothetical protein [Ignavibacteria bacterium]